MTAVTSLAISGSLVFTALMLFHGPAQASVQSCRAFTEKGVHASALVACSAVINKSGTRPATKAAALFYRANSRYSTRDIAGALNDINASLDLVPDFGPAIALRAAIRLQTGDTRGAGADLDRAIALGQNGTDLRSRRGILRLSTGDLEGAVEDLEAVVAAAPRDAIAHLRLAIALNELGRNGPALDAANRAVELNRDYADAYGVRAKIKSERGDLDGALEDFARAETGAARGTRYLIGKADILARSGRADEALATIAAVLATEPKSRTAAVLKADILQSAGRVAEARAALGELARSDPALAVRNARLALSIGDFDAAAADYTTAIALDPTLAAAHFERGQVYFKTGKWARAIADFDTALASDAGFAKRRLHYLRGKARYRSGDLEGAVADFSADLAIAETADGHLWRALAFTDLGEFGLALEDATQLVAMAPERARAHAVLGDVLLKAGRLAQGRKAHEKALAIDPGFAPSLQRMVELGAAE